MKVYLSYSSNEVNYVFNYLTCEEVKHINDITYDIDYKYFENGMMNYEKQAMETKREVEKYLDSIGKHYIRVEYIKGFLNYNYMFYIVARNKEGISYDN